MAKQETAVAVKESAVPVAMAEMFASDAGQGFEEAGRESYAIPFLKILQSLSPQCKKSEPEYIKGAEEGDFFNTVTEKVYPNDKGGIKFVPSYFRRVFNLWTPKEDGGGFRGSMTSAEGEMLLRECSKDKDGSDVTPDGLLLVDTREHYGLIVEEDGNSVPVLLALSSSQIKESKKWMTMMQGLRLPNGQPAPMASHIYNLTTVPKSNDKGSWAVLKAQDAGYTPTKELYEAATQFREMIRSGEAKAAEREEGF